MGSGVIASAQLRGWLGEGTGFAPGFIGNAGSGAGTAAGFLTAFAFVFKLVGATVGLSAVAVPWWRKGAAAARGAAGSP